MHDALTSARFYLSPPVEHFWLWSEDGEVVQWKRGDTIAFRAELLFVLERLAPHGLPPFDEVLLLFASCRWNTAPSSDFVVSLLDSEGPGDDGPAAWPYDVVSAIDRMWRLPADVREPLDAKAILAEVVFEGRSPILPPDVARVVVELLRTASPTGFTQGVEFLGYRRKSALRESLESLSRGMDRVEVESLRLRRRTGLDDMPGAAAENPPEEPTLRELIATLSSDAELGGMARLARNLLAVAELPRRLGESDELPLGGVSDVGNRGTFDRLLLSELAHDDLTLSVRVALNEALYLRRESPPRTPPERRFLLIDSGLRLWGVPRIFAASVALAFAAAADKNATVQAWRASGDSLSPVDLRTRDGLTEHLAALDATLHPGASLPDFTRECTEACDAPEALLITAAETLDDADFQRALAEYAPLRLFIATVRRSGEFQLWLRTSQGKKLLREAQLDLERILFPEKRPVATTPLPLIRAEVSGLPAIFGMSRFPLLLPHRISANNTHIVKSPAFLALACDGRLTFWNDKAHAGRQVAEGVPYGAVFWWDTGPGDSPSSIEMLIQSSPDRPPQLVRVNSSSGAVFVQTVEWHDGLVTGAWAYDGTLCVVGETGCEFAAYHRITAQLLERRTFSDATPSKPGSRFLWARTSNSSAPNVATRELVQVSWISGKFGLSAVDAPPPATEGTRRPILFDPVNIETVFKRTGIDGPFAIERYGQLINLADGTRSPLSPGIGSPIQVLDVDADGTSALVQAGTLEISGGRTVGQGRFLVDLASGRRTIVPKSVKFIRQWHISNRPHPRQLRRRWSGIRCETGSISLWSRHGKAWRILLDGDRIVLRHGTSASTSGVIPFEPVQSGARQLEMATWKDTSRAFLDPRGLLHLQSSDKSIPEATLVLSDDGVAGWSSDGRMWGDPYFLGNVRPESSRVIFNEIIRPFSQRCGWE